MIYFTRYKNIVWNLILFILFCSLSILFEELAINLFNLMVYKLFRVTIIQE